ncbi:uncharacterized protein LY89DRAFT_780489 [Mollisia scopiformis]|uniref:Uncharacterized protein n=1 Tax=Mollisia scopiformis TaxID=149040 RepID=A0A194XH85_MOLSC|nr:uncharacterized protein LY89DRAFT_780489 [Mollisia scopiformis]KUJ19570.1 hypothetical protein LY89DRAFT_780489 [Mollisia scopiformis]
MSAEMLRQYVDLILKSPALQHFDTIRIDTKSLAYWPYRYLTDPDAKSMLKLFEDAVSSGKHLAFQAHFSNPRELETPVVQEAIRMISMTSAQIRTQSPLIRMSIERDSGARHYFSVPLLKAYKIFNTAYSKIGGVARTVRGPSMTTLGGKLGIAGTPTINGEPVFALKFFSTQHGLSGCFSQNSTLMRSGSTNWNPKRNSFGKKNVRRLSSSRIQSRQDKCSKGVLSMMIRIETFLNVTR